MSESAWHRRTREEVLQSYELNAYSSHAKISRLELFRGEKMRENCLSNVDIVVMDSTKENIIELIEIETAMNPKKLIGIVLATHFCDSCVTPNSDSSVILKKDIKPLNNISLRIICRKEKEKSKKPLKLTVIKKALEEIILNTPGSLSNFSFEERP